LVALLKDIGVLTGQDSIKERKKESGHDSILPNNDCSMRVEVESEATMDILDFHYPPSCSDFFNISSIDAFVFLSASGKFFKFQG
jgi:hypothetical protein